MQAIYKVPGYILCLLGGFFLSWGGLIIRNFETHDVWQILFWRALFMTLTIAVFLILIYKRQTINVIKKAGFLGLIGGFIFSTSFSAYIIAISQSTVANVLFIISTQTIWLALFGYIFLREKISFKTFLSILLAMLGIFIMVRGSLNIEALFGNLVALSIPINFAVIVLIIRKYPNLDMVPMLFYAGVLSCIYGLVMSDTIIVSSHDVFMGFLIGTFQHAFGFICVTIGSRSTPSVVVGLLMLTETLFGPLWVWLFINETPPLTVFIGGFIILSAVVLKSIEQKYFK
jgi:DME family drug/metabolite transporter